jgi:tetratricopeptide (TPR) repeat protein
MSAVIDQNLLNAIEKYQSNLEQLENNISRISPKSVLQLLRSRDTVEQNLANIDVDDSEDTCASLLAIDQQLNQLDDRLKEQEHTIAEKLSLDYWRKRINVTEEAWWWNFEAPKRIPVWDRLDWLWDFATLVVLALSASFIFSIFKALSVGEFTIVETFSTIAQVGGLAVVSQGALTQTGREKVRVLLEKLNIPDRYHSELLLAFSLVLLAAIYYSHQRLDQYYIEDGKKLYADGQLAAAENAYLRALEIAPNNVALHTDLGQIYESMGDLDSALTHYSTSANAGEIRGLNNMGRTLINRVNPILTKPVPEMAEAFLLLGLKHVEDNQSEKRSDKEKDLHYQLARNAGWALLMQKKYSEAEKMLTKAVDLDESIPGNQTGGGMAYCFLAETYDQLGKKTLANKNWINCLEKARPETIIEYKWLINKKQGAFVNCIDTTRVITLTDSELDKNKNQRDKDYVDEACMQQLKKQIMPTDLSTQINMEQNS